MARLSISLMLFGLLSTRLVGALPQYDQEEQHSDANCDNGCFFDSFPGGSCTDDEACMCTQNEYRQAYFCCMAEKCDSSVLPDSLVRQHRECKIRKMDFTFDVEEVCGITLTTSASSTTSPTTTSDSSSASKTDTPSATEASTESTPDATTEASSAGTTAASGTESTAPTQTGSASQARVGWSGLAILVVASGLLLS